MMIKVLEQESILKSGAANLNVLRVDINQTTDPELRDLWITMKQKRIRCHPQPWLGH